MLVTEVLAGLHGSNDHYIHSHSGNAAVPPFEIFPLDDQSERTGAEHDWVYRVARHLLGHQSDDAIHGMLKEIGEQAGVDRAWMFEYSSDQLRFSNTHEWTRPSVAPHVEELQDVSIGMIAWLHQSLVKGDAVAVNNVAGLPRAARRLQIEFIRQGNKSVLCVPIMHSGVLRGCFGFDATRMHRRWKADIAAVLFRCADLISLARYDDNRRDRSRPKPVVSVLQSPAPIIYLRVRGGVRGVAPNSILGLRSSKDYSNIWLSDGTITEDHRSLSTWLGMLPRAHFQRIHRTAIVNLTHVRDLDRYAGSSGGRWDLFLRSQSKPWAVSRPYRQELRKRLGI